MCIDNLLFIERGLFVSKDNVPVSFECDKRFEKFLSCRASSLGISRSQLIRNAILLEGVLGCDGEALSILVGGVRKQYSSVLSSLSVHVGAA